MKYLGSVSLIVGLVVLAFVVIDYFFIGKSFDTVLILVALVFILVGLRGRRIKR